jgi:hypothetical protein
VTAALAPLELAWSGPMTTRDGLAIGQVSPTRDGDGIRRLVVVAPAGRDDELAVLVWHRDLGLLARYLMHAAKLDYHQWVLRRDQDGLLRQRSQMHERLERLHELVAAEADADDAALDRVYKELKHFQGDKSGVVDSLIQVRTMRRTVAIAAANMAAIAAVIRPDRPAGTGAPVAGADFVTVDQAIATAVDHDLVDQMEYLDAARQRAEYFADIVERELDRRARDADMAAERRAEAAQHRRWRCCSPPLWYACLAQRVHHTRPAAKTPSSPSQERPQGTGRLIATHPISLRCSGTPAMVGGAETARSPRPHGRHRQPTVAG